VRILNIQRHCILFSDNRYWFIHLWSHSIFCFCCRDRADCNIRSLIIH